MPLHKRTKDEYPSVATAQRLHEQAQRHMNRAVELLSEATGCNETVAICLVANIAGFVMSDYASRMNGYEGEL